MQEVFRTVLNMSISGSVVIAAVLLGRLLLRRAPKKWSYILWSAAAFRLCCPVGVRSAISLFRVLPKPVSSGEATSGTFGRLSYIPPAAVVPPATALPAEPSAVNTTALPSATAAPVTPAPAGLVGGVVSAASPMQTVMTVLCAVWLAGIAALIVYAAVDYIRLRRLTFAATKLDGEKAVFRSEVVRSPFILGSFRPRIYIPYTLAGKEFEYVLAHEKAHLRRGDHIVKAFAFILLALHWFNPLCWLAFLLMSSDMEMSCDEKVLARGSINAEYSTTLLSLASAKRFPAPNPLCFGEGAVRERIKNAVKYKKPKLTITLISAVLAILIIASCATDPTGKNPGPNPSVPTEPTAEPTPAPTAGPKADDGAVNAALRFISHINELYGTDYIGVDAKANGFLCRFGPASGPAWRLIETVVSHNDGSDPNVPDEYYISEAYPLGDAADREYSQWSASLDMDRWWNEFSKAEHVLTEREIADSGCTATEGAEYSQAAADCYAKLLAELFKTAPEGSPMRCREADVYSCRLLDEPEWATPDRYIEFEVWIAVIPDDIHGFWEYTDLTSHFYCDENDPYYCRMWIGGKIGLHRNGDGDWYGTAVLGAK